MNTSAYMTSAQLCKEYPAFFPTEAAVAYAARMRKLAHHRMSERRLVFARRDVEKFISSCYVPANPQISEKAMSKIHLKAKP